MEDIKATIPLPEDHQKINDYYEKLWLRKDLDVVYDEYADTYDHLNDLIAYHAHSHVSKQLLACFKDEEVATKLILDVGSGTGRLGKSLTSFGFKELHALDLSKASLEEAQKKNIYTSFYQSAVTSEPINGIQRDTYDAVVSSGCFIPNHIKVEAIEELIRITKQGGFIVFTLRDPDFEMNYMNTLGRFMMEKKVELLAMNLIPYKREYTQNYEQVYAYLIAFKVL